MTKRDLAVSALTAALVLAATYYGGPLAGKATKAVVVPRVEKALRGGDALLESAEVPGWPQGSARVVAISGALPRGFTCGYEFADGRRLLWHQRADGRCYAADVPLAVPAPIAPRAAVPNRPPRVAEPAPPDRTYYQTLLRAGLFPVTTHEAWP